MNAKTLAAVALSAALAVVGIWTVLGRDAAVAPAPGSEAVAGAPALETAQALPGSGSPRAALPPAEEAAASPALAPLTGTLAVVAVFSDGAPAAGVALALHAEDDPALDRADAQVVADEEGRARAELHPGRIALSSDRGGKLRAELAAGEEREVRFEIPRGVDVEGLVLDRDGRPVGGAGIWLTTGQGGWLGGRIVARADERGAFRLRSADPLQSVGARAPGFAPSALVDLEHIECADERCTVELRLTSTGAAVAGRVLGEEGRAVAGALVALGHRGGSNRAIDGTQRENWSPEVVRTAADGSFRLAGALPGETYLSVRAEGYALWHEGHTLAPGETLAVEVQLERGVTVRGTVRDESGAPMEGITIRASRDPFDRGGGRVGMWDGPSAFGHPAALSGASGGYDLRHAPSGLVHLLADVPFLDQEPGRESGRDEAELAAASGAELVWDPVLSLGLAIRGRLVSATGDAPRMCTVITATPEVAGAHNVQTLNDIDGAFVLPHCDAAPYTLSVHGQDVSLAGVWPGAGEVVLTLPPEVQSAVVRGRLVDAAGRLREKPVGVMLESDALLLWEGILDGEEFSFPLVDPGRYHLFARGGMAEVLLTDWFEVAAGEELDLGEIRTRPGGALVVRVELKTGAALVRPWAILGEGFAGVVIPWDGEEFRAESLDSGERLLHVGEAGLFAPATPVEIRPGETTTLRLAFERAVRVPLAIGAPPRDVAWTRMTIRVRDQAGAVIVQRLLLRTAGVDYPYAMPTDLPAGSFTLSTELDTGRTAERAFKVTSLSAPPAEVLIAP